MCDPSNTCTLSEGGRNTFYKQKHERFRTGLHVCIHLNTRTGTFRWDEVKNFWEGASGPSVFDIDGFLRRTVKVLSNLRRFPDTMNLVSASNLPLPPHLTATFRLFFRVHYVVFPWSRKGHLVYLLLERLSFFSPETRASLPVKRFEF